MFFKIIVACFLIVLHVLLSSDSQVASSINGCVQSILQDKILGCAKLDYHTCPIIGGLLYFVGRKGASFPSNSGASKYLIVYRDPRSLGKQVLFSSCEVHKNQAN